MPFGQLILQDSVSCLEEEDYSGIESSHGVVEAVGVDDVDVVDDAVEGMVVGVEVEPVALPLGLEDFSMRSLDDCSSLPCNNSPSFGKWDDCCGFPQT